MHFCKIVARANNTIYNIIGTNNKYIKCNYRLKSIKLNESFIIKRSGGSNVAVV